MHTLIALVLVAAFFLAIYLIQKFGIVQVKKVADDDFDYVEAETKADIVQAEAKAENAIVEIKTKL